MTTSNTPAPARERQTLFTRAVFFVRQLRFNSLWVGTALSISDLKHVQSAVNAVSTDSLYQQIVAGFRALDAAAVEATLCHFLRISEPLVKILAGELAGRGRTTSEFLVYCWTQRARTDEDVARSFEEFRKIILSIPYSVHYVPASSRSLSGCWQTLLLTESTGTV